MDPDGVTRCGLHLWDRGVAGPLQLGQRDGTTGIATGEVHSYMSSARLSAMGINRSVTVTLSQAGSIYQVDVLDANGQRMTPMMSLPVSIVTTQLDGVSITGALPATQRQVTFNSLGMRTTGAAGNQLITLFNKDGLIYSVVIFPTGKTRWCTTPTCP